MFAHADPDTQADALSEFLDRAGRVTVLTGAGCSTDSGIPDYRDAAGQWKHTPPVQWQDFVGQPAVRQRYWARSMLGWPLIHRAQPNRAHKALRILERAQKVQMVITQNVDGLHQKAGSERVVDLHGRLDTVRCLDCGVTEPREALQLILADANPGWLTHAEGCLRPDGDMELKQELSQFRVPNCRRCCGILKPDVVFFGEAVPRARVERAFDALHGSGALLVVGSSLMVFSGFRFAREASRNNRPLALLNRGRTRADDLATLKLDGSCGAVLGAVARHFAGSCQAAGTSHQSGRYRDGRWGQRMRDFSATGCG